MRHTDAHTHTHTHTHTHAHTHEARSSACVCHCVGWSSLPPPALTSPAVSAPHSHCPLLHCRVLYELCVDVTLWVLLRSSSLPLVSCFFFVCFFIASVHNWAPRCLIIFGSILLVRPRPEDQGSDSRSLPARVLVCVFTPPLPLCTLRRDWD